MLTIVLVHGASADASSWNEAPHPDPSTCAKKFVGRYTHRTIEGGIAHNLPLEAPQAFADAIVEVDGY